MNIKSLLLGFSGALVTVSGAYAADAVVVAEPEPVEYVRVCDAFGKAFFYIPGTETCMKISGYIRSDVKGGADSYTGLERDTYFIRSRADMRMDTRSETELGTLRSYTELRYNFDNGTNSELVQINNAYIELGGFRVGATDSRFNSWTDYLGDVLSDDVIQPGEYVDNQISYTFKGSKGLSAFISAEQGSKGYQIDDYMPHLVSGVKLEQAWGSVAGVAGYDVLNEEWAIKARVDLNFTDKLSGWVMAAYKSNGDDFGGNNNYFGTWNGDYAVWGGIAAKVTDKATINAQAAYEDDGTFAAALNVAYEPVPGFVITPEIDYTAFRGNRGAQNAIDAALKGASASSDSVQGVLRFQRNF
jgi:hypothetical protein